jgi:NAD(P)-dependent dehydrogenase (short-subunit alcohol dehydrogenase family)
VRQALAWLWLACGRTASTNDSAYCQARGRLSLTWKAMPETLTVREIRVAVAIPGFRTEQLIIATTLLDDREFPRPAAGQRRFRSQVGDRNESPAAPASQRLAAEDDGAREVGATGAGARPRRQNLRRRRARKSPLSDSAGSVRVVCG